jgi:hypothetical protein
MKNISLKAFIEKLQQFPMDAGVYIDDADTNWRIGIIRFAYDPIDKTLCLYGKYSEMTDDLDGAPYVDPPGEQ